MNSMSDSFFDLFELRREKLVPLKLCSLAARGLWVDLDGAVKIGCSLKPAARLSTIRAKHGFDVILLRTWPVNDMGEAEFTLHEFFKEFLVSGEWFWLTDEQIGGVEEFLKGFGA